MKHPTQISEETVSHFINESMKTKTMMEAKKKAKKSKAKKSKIRDYDYSDEEGAGNRERQEMQGDHQEQQKAEMRNRPSRADEGLQRQIRRGEATRLPGSGRHNNLGHTQANTPRARFSQRYRQLRAMNPRMNARDKAGAVRTAAAKGYLGDKDETFDTNISWVPPSKGRDIRSGTWDPTIERPPMWGASRKWPAAERLPSGKYPGREGRYGSSEPDTPISSRQPRKVRGSKEGGVPLGRKASPTERREAVQQSRSKRESGNLRQLPDHQEHEGELQNEADVRDLAKKAVDNVKGSRTFRKLRVLSRRGGPLNQAAKKALEAEDFMRAAGSPTMY